MNKKYKNLVRQMALHATVIGLLFLWILGIERTSVQFINEIVVQIDQMEDVNDLVTTEDIHLYVTKELPNDILNQKINRIDFEMIERLLSKDSRIHNVEVFLDAKNDLVIEVIQRRPILRVMNYKSDQYYIDQSGHYIRKGDYRATRVPVVTGYVEDFAPNQELEDTPKLNDAYLITKTIRKDKVLTALIEQIHFEKNGRIILIPKIGTEKIILDHMDELDIKLGQLKTFYRELARTDSWGKYKEIDISYKSVVYGRNPEQP